jgi:hypothetical protein
VVSLGLTRELPDNPTLPTSGVITTLIAPETSQVKVELSPSSIVRGLAIKLVTMGAEPEGVQPIIKAGKSKMTPKNKMILFIFLHLFYFSKF